MNKTYPEGETRDTAGNRQPDQVVDMLRRVYSPPAPRGWICPKCGTVYSPYYHGPCSCVPPKFTCTGG